MLSFLHFIHFAMKNNSQHDVLDFYTYFSTAFNRVPHFELIKKIAGLEVKGCKLEILSDYLEDWSQVVRVGTSNSTKMKVPNGVPQGSVFGPLLFCMFINDLLDALKFSEPFIFADDSKTLGNEQDPA